MLKNDENLSQKNANVPVKDEDCVCLMEHDKDFMYIGERIALAECGSCFRDQEVHLINVLQLLSPKTIRSNQHSSSLDR